MFGAYNINEVFRSDESAEQLARLKADAAEEAARRDLDFEMNDRGGVKVGEWRPGNRAVVARLLGGDTAQPAYSYYSGVAHGAFWAMLARLDSAQAPPSPATPNLRPIVASADSIAMALRYAAVAYRAAVAVLFKLHGWPTDTLVEPDERLSKASGYTPLSD